MEQEGYSGENKPDLSSAQNMVEQAFKGEEDHTWADELCTKLNSPDEFLSTLSS